MSSNKKYYYLKLKENFFDSEEMIILQSMQDGYLYSDILLKLYLRSDFYERGYRIIKFNRNLNGTNYLKILSILLRHGEAILDSCIEELSRLNILSIQSNGIVLRDLNVDIDRNRSGKKYKSWRDGVFKRDDYTCQMCKLRGGKLEAHHIYPWHSHNELRYELNNGTTLCIPCHRNIHRKGNNNVK